MQTGANPGQTVTSLCLMFMSQDVLHYFLQISFTETF